MTIEEAVRQLTINRPSAYTELREAISMAIKALEQEHCEDAISREVVLDMIYNVDGMEGFENSNIFAKHYVNKVKALPSVTPQQKVGKWSRVTDKAGYWVWECDKCGWQQRFNTNFCPQCGSYNGGNDNGDE